MRLSGLRERLSSSTPSEKAVELQRNQQFRGCSTRKLTHVRAMPYRPVYMGDTMFRRHYEMLAGSALFFASALARMANFFHYRKGWP